MLSRRYDDASMDKGKPMPQETNDQSLAQLGVRIPRSLHFSLKAACLQQERDGKKPATQAEIVKEALIEWLARNGFETEQKRKGR